MSDVAFLTEWVPDPDWTTSPEIIAGKTCRQRKCDRPAAAALNRGRKTPQGEVDSWWCYCDKPEHMYTRRIRHGVVEIEAMVGSNFWKFMKGPAVSDYGHLVVTIRQGEPLRVGECLITLLEVRGPGRVKVAVDAPKDVPIHRAGFTEVSS